MKFLPPFLFQKIEVYVALIHNFELSSVPARKIIFSIPPKLAKNAIFVFRGLELVTS